MSREALDSVIAMLRARPANPDASWGAQRADMEERQQGLEIPEDVIQLIVDCVSYEPEDRPTAKEIAKRCPQVEVVQHRLDVCHQGGEFVRTSVQWLRAAAEGHVPLRPNPAPDPTAP